MPEQTAPTTSAVSATIPIALHNLADHITTHHLPTPTSVEINGPLVGEPTPPAVNIYLDRINAAAWLNSIRASAADATTTAHEASGIPMGDWYDIHGVANAIKVKLSWYVPAVPAPLALVDHETCRGGCGATLCYCRGRETTPCPGAVEGACRHGNYLCHGCMAGCEECADDVAGVRAESRGNRP